MCKGKWNSGINTLYIEKEHTPPVSPSSYNVKPSIWRYPWKRSLFTHNDKLLSSYSATQTGKIFQKQKHRAHQHSAQRLPIIKRESRRVYWWLECKKISVCHLYAFLGNKEQDRSWAVTAIGQINNDQKLFWQPAASGLTVRQGIQDLKQHNALWLRANRLAIDGDVNNQTQQMAKS